MQALELHASATIKQVQPTKVSIGLPVFNGERYVKHALDSILSQTYQEFELIISDNASTDRTEEICREYASRDRRILYQRQEYNRGVTWNFRQVASLASGKYFLWVAADDTLDAEYLERCLQILQQHSEIVLCYSKAIVIDENGNCIRREEQKLGVSSEKPHERFRDLIRMDHNCGALFGLMRTAVLKKTPIHGDFADSDRCVLAELALYGQYYRIPEHLFCHREHGQRVTRMYPSRQERTFKLYPENPPKVVFPHFRQFWEYIRCIQRAPLPLSERVQCYMQMLRWLRDNSKHLLYDIRFALHSAAKPLWRAACIN
jgi:glycosyltransferase involved in cell wall biosynthesis